MCQIQVKSIARKKNLKVKKHAVLDNPTNTFYLEKIVVLLFLTPLFYLFDATFSKSGKVAVTYALILSCTMGISDNTFLFPRLNHPCNVMERDGTWN